MISVTCLHKAQESKSLILRWLLLYRKILLINVYLGKYPNKRGKVIEGTSSLELEEREMRRGKMGAAIRQVR